jgi:hypothetical protein
MRPISWLTPVLALAGYFLLLPPMAGDDLPVAGCPDGVCLQTQTSLVYDKVNARMYAYTSVIMDNWSKNYYSACIYLTISRINGPNEADGTILFDTTTPMCTAFGAVELGRDVGATPGRQYYATGRAELSMTYTYQSQVVDCGSYCNGTWFDAYSWSTFSGGSQAPYPNGPSIGVAYPADSGDPWLTYTYWYEQQIEVITTHATAWSPPRIDSVIPNQWQAGVKTDFVINGAGFGSAPTVAITGSGITSVTYTCPTSWPTSCDTQIVGTVTIDANTPAGSVEAIAVTAGGMNAIGFLPVETPGQSGVATAYATTLLYDPPAPQIMLGTNASGKLCSTGTDVAGTTQNVVIGQPIAFTGCIPEIVPQIQVANVFWSPSSPHGVAVGGYTVTATSGSVVPLSYPICSALQRFCEFPKFYWVKQGTSLTFTFTYENCCGPSRSATITFNVVGPTATGPGGAFLTGTVQDPPDGTVPKKTLNVWPAAVPYMGLGKNGQNPGIRFFVREDESATPRGKFQFVQVLTKARVKMRSSAGEEVFGLAGAAVITPTNPALDNWYPYAARVGDSKQALDDPGQSLNLARGSQVGESMVEFEATMYLLWDPALPGSGQSSCQAASNDPPDPEHPNPQQSTCTGSIPVPLGSISWGYTGDAINTMKPNMDGASNGTGWLMLGCSWPVPTPMYSSSGVYPTWNRVFTNSK